MASKTKKIAIGIDLGTSNSCVAICKDGRPETIPTKTGDLLLPSWVTYTDKEVLIGKISKERSAKHLKTTIFATKRILGRQFNDPVVQAAIEKWKFKILEDSTGVPKIEVQHDNKVLKVSPEEISALILKELKESAEAYLDETEITDAVITVPAYFNDHQRQATTDAAKIAGLNVLRLINEPTAAAVAYIHNNREKQNRNVLVYDLGGGTFDVSVVSMDDSTIRVKATYGDSNLGGLNFDERCIEYLTAKVKQKYKIDEEKEGYMKRFLNLAEKAKEYLSTSVETTVDFVLYDGTDIYEEFTRARFEDLNDDLFLKTIEIVEQCIKQANLRKEDIHDILLVGGSTIIPKLKEYLTKLFSKPVSSAINREHGVAHGAAILAASLNGNLSTTLKISDVTAMSLGIEILNGEMNVLIKRSSQIPTQAKQVYTTGVKGENAIKITVLEGDRPLAADNSILGDFDLVDLPIDPTVEVTFDVDCSGILTVSAVEASTKISKVINVIPHKGRLTEQEISFMRQKSYMVKKKNQECNSIKEKRNEIEGYLLRIERHVKSDAYILNTKKRDILLNKIEEWLTWLNETDDVKAIEIKYNEIQRYCTDIPMN